MTRFGIGWLAAPATAYCVLLFAIPLAVLLLGSLHGPAGWTLAGYTTFFGSASAWGVIGRTLRLAAITTAICFAIGYPAAFALSWARGWLQSVLVAALLLPLSLSVIVKAFGWTVLLRGDGLINVTLQAIGLTSSPMRLLFTETGLLIGIVNIFLPFMVLPLFASIRQLDPRLVRRGGNTGRRPGPLLPARHIAADGAWHRRRRHSGVLAVDRSLCHSDAADGRRLPDVADHDRHGVPVSAGSAARFGCRGGAAGAVPTGGRGERLARPPVERIMTRLVARAFAGAMLAASVVFLLMPLAGYRTRFAVALAGVRLADGHLVVDLVPAREDFRRTD